MVSLKKKYNGPDKDLEYMFNHIIFDVPTKIRVQVLSGVMEWQGTQMGRNFIGTKTTDLKSWTETAGPKCRNRSLQLWLNIYVIKIIIGNLPKNHLMSVHIL